LWARFKACVIRFLQPGGICSPVERQRTFQSQTSRFLLSPASLRSRSSVGMTGVKGLNSLPGPGRKVKSPSSRTNARNGAPILSLIRILFYLMRTAEPPPLVELWGLVQYVEPTGTLLGDMECTRWEQLGWHTTLACSARARPRKELLADETPVHLLSRGSWSNADSWPLIE
jgi:hypothetical protein